MAESQDPYPWTRRDNETDPAYEAFRLYLNMGGSRSTMNVAKQLSKSKQLITDWSSRHQWVSRVMAYDHHLENAAVDGHAEELKNLRTKHLKLAEKLMDHLDHRLDEMINKNQDPSVRWTQAYTAMNKAAETWAKIGDQGQVSGALERALELVRQLATDEGD